MPVSTRRTFLILASTGVIAGCDRDGVVHRQGLLKPAAGSRIPDRPPRAVGFPGMSDERVLRSLRREAIVRVDKGSGGRSLSFKLELADGARAYYKPEQSFAAYWYSEVASFHLDRVLGLGRVVPVASRRLAWSTLARAAGSDERVRELRIDHDGSIRGALIAWIEREVPPLPLPPGWESWLSIDRPPRVSPFQRVNAWRAGRTTAARGATAPAPDTPERAAELSDLIVFDYLIGNLDRWGGEFTNVRTLGRRGPLIFLDNANGFEPGRERTPLLDRRLHAVQRFRRSTIEAIRALDVGVLEQRMADEELEPILGAAQLRAIDVRRRHVIEHVATLERRYGRDATPW